MLDKYIMYNIHNLENTIVVGVLQLIQSREVVLNQMRWKTMSLTKLMKCHIEGHDEELEEEEEEEEEEEKEEEEEEEDDDDDGDETEA